MQTNVNPNPVILLNCFALLASCLLGCGGNSAPSLADVNNTNIKKLRGAYGLYQINNHLTGPENEEDFKDFLKNDPRAKTKLERMGVTTDKVDDIFISDRDGQPFKVRYGLRGLSDYAIVFEAEGIDGKRLVSFTEPKEVGNTEYEKLWNSKNPINTGTAKGEMSSAFD